MEAYPLCWPEGWPRTNNPEWSRFKQTPDRARRALLKEIRRLIGYRYRRDEVILSTNVKLRLDGEPYTGLRAPDDAGVAVYFEYKERPMVFACDRWAHVHENIYAIAKTIEALRGIERWGASDMLERAFTGFLALEHQPGGGWRDLIGYTGNDKQQAERFFRGLIKDAHPDRLTGDSETFHVLIKAREQMRSELA